MTATNGKHRGTDIFSFEDKISVNIRVCPTDKCLERARVFPDDYYSARLKECGNGHPYLVWYHPINKTYLISSS